MQFSRDNIKPGTVVICGDSTHPMKARMVIKLGLSGEGVYAIGKDDNGDEWYTWNEITAIVPDEDEWHPLTRENISEYLAVGDEVEVKVTRDVFTGKIEKMLHSGGTGICGKWHRDGKFWGENTWNTPSTKFRLIRKGKQEEAKELRIVADENKNILKLELRLPKQEEAKGEENPTTATEILAELHHNQWQEYQRCKAIISEQEKEAALIFSNYIKPHPGLIQKAMSKFNELLDAVKVANMSETDKLLYEGGMKDIEGNYTQDFFTLFERDEAKRDKEALKAKRDAFALTLVETIKKGKKLVEEKEK